LFTDNTSGDAFYSGRVRTEIKGVLKEKEAQTKTSFGMKCKKKKIDIPHMLKISMKRVEKERETT